MSSNQRGDVDRPITLPPQPLFPYHDSGTMGNDHDRIVLLEGQMSEMRNAVATMSGMMGKLNDQVTEIARDTKEIREIWIESRGAFRLFRRAAAVVKAVFTYLVLPVGVVCGAVYAWTHHGKAPEWLSSLLEIVK